MVNADQNMDFKQQVKKNIKWVIAGFFMAYALCTDSSLSLIRANYETTLDYVIASIYAFLGEYNLHFLIVWGVFLFYLNKSREVICVHKQENHKVVAGALFFAFWSVVGRSFYDTNSFDYIFGSVVNFGKTVLQITGYFLLWREAFYVAFQLLDYLMKKAYEDKTWNDKEKKNIEDKTWNDKAKEASENRNQKKLFGKRVAFFLAMAYLPIVLLSFPGNLCYDSCGQITQVLTGVYTEHAPLAHTLIMGGLTALGGLVGSYEVGLFLYCLLQTAMLIGAMIWVLIILYQKGTPKVFLYGIMALYILTPIYSNLTSTPIKDVPFVAFMLVYATYYQLVIRWPKMLLEKKNWVLFVLLQVGVVISRNNGFYVVVISGIVMFFYIRKHLLWYGALGKSFLCGALLGKLIMLTLALCLHAKPGSTGEVLSIPFQQTARYLQLYRAELTDEERDAIQAVLGDTLEIAEAYNPNISDPVKALLKDEIYGRQWLSYFLTWGKLFFKHPVAYVEAFVSHIYGWFSPFVSNEIRYEAVWDEIMPRSSFGELRYKVLIFLYRFIERISIFGFLENVGVYVWGLFAGTIFFRSKNKSAEALSLTPLWVSLLICLASPCFFNHPRYALPIMICLPVLLIAGVAMNEGGTSR